MADIRSLYLIGW